MGRDRREGRLEASEPMSDPKRYNDVIGMLTDQCHQYALEVERLKAMPHDDDTCPHLVRANLLEAENARLKAEVERLTVFTTRTIIPNEELQKQVERLTKAGDAMAFIMAHQKDSEFNGFIEDWNAAKEGKGQP